MLFLRLFAFSLYSQDTPINVHVTIHCWSVNWHSTFWLAKIIMAEAGHGNLLVPPSPHVLKSEIFLTFSFGGFSSFRITVINNRQGESFKKIIIFTISPTFCISLNSNYTNWPVNFAYQTSYANMAAQFDLWKLEGNNV